MWKRITVVCGVVCCAAVLPSLVQTKEPDQISLLREITPDGPALFFSVEDDRRRELWSVDCRQRLRGCTARAPGLVVRLDEEHRPWILASATPETRISIQHKNHIWDTPALLNRPLDTGTLERMSAAKSFLVLEEQGHVVLRVRTEALDEVVAYLRWISGETARTLGDARLWPRDSPISAQNMTPETLERYEIMQRRRLDGARQMVPQTKPQIEFALRAQGGQSFFDNTGRSGY